MKVIFQLCAPKQKLTEFIGRLAGGKYGKLTSFIIRAFIRTYNVNMAESKLTDPEDFATFNDFFVRALKSNMRPIDPDAATITYPADATVGQLGEISMACRIQTKGHDFSVLDLLGGDSTLAAEFTGGSFSRFYLSPRNYHRVHMPCDGILRDVIYIPGELFSVDVVTEEHIPRVFSRNERVVCIFDTKFGTIAQILVGAIIVGSIELTWYGVVNADRKGGIKRWTYPPAGPGHISLKKGEEMGRFRLGSTVINLFQRGKIDFDKDFVLNCETLVGLPFAIGRNQNMH